MTVSDSTTAAGGRGDFADPRHEPPSGPLAPEGLNDQQVASPAAFLSRLIAGNRLSAQTAEQVERIRTETGGRLCAVLLKLGLLSEPDLAAELALHARLPLIQRIDLTRPSPVLEQLNPSFLHARGILPIEADETTLSVVCWDPLDAEAVEALRFATGLELVRQVAPRREVLTVLERVYPLTAPTAESGDPSFAGIDDDEVDRLKDLASDAPVIRLVQRLLDDAVAARASDVHLETTEGGLQVRLRTDGLLRLHGSYPKPLAAPVVSRLKVMAGLNIAERRLPQDGRLRLTIRGKVLDFRVATSPTLHGESVVLRILDQRDVSLDLDALGFDSCSKAALHHAVSRPSGIVLVTGPTGSGKTTTLYAALATINSLERKILTVEDPVEYLLPGVNQVPVHPQIGLSFARALRSFLRQDPDVLMVGEIRDRETAEIAIQAALTGHLLLSTLHTNSAAAAVTRLLDMGIDDYLLTSTLNLALGQRLVRRLCEHCRESYPVDDKLRRRFGLATQPSLDWYRAVGCEVCQGSGYSGRTALLEALVMTDTLRARVLAHADAHEIEREAVQQGMRTLLQHGLERVSDGTTTIEEVLRVINLAESVGMVDLETR